MSTKSGFPSDLTGSNQTLISSLNLGSLALTGQKMFCAKPPSENGLQLPIVSQLRRF
jgi:hypothetical protein